MWEFTTISKSHNNFGAEKPLLLVTVGADGYLAQLTVQLAVLLATSPPCQSKPVDSL